MRRIGVYAKSNEKSEKVKDRILSFIKEKGLIFDNDNPEVVFVIGGDGTFLKAANNYLDKIDDIAFIGIKTGHLGYFYDFQEEDIPYVFDHLDSLLKNVTKHLLIKAHLKNKDEESLLHAVNEIRIENPFHTLEAEVFLNGQKFEDFNGNGLMVATSIGSSAYNKSLGGAVVDSSIDIMELTEIATIQSSVHRSLGSSFILAKDSSILFRGDFKNVVVGYDNKTFPIGDFTEIEISLSNKRLSIIRPKDYFKFNVIKASFID